MNLGSLLLGYKMGGMWNVITSFHFIYLAIQQTWLG